jgi:hypothetical protein
VIIHCVLGEKAVSDSAASRPLSAHVPVRARLAQLLFQMRDVEREHEEERAVGDAIGDDCRLQRVLPTPMLSARMKPDC